LYGRVSQVAERGQPGKSVDDQLAENRSWARREDWKVVGEHRDDGISASRYARGKVRPGWTQVMELIAAGGVDLLVV
jgi:DNA invertase Pin-like site-specific DNA recombinase